MKKIVYFAMTLSFGTLMSCGGSAEAPETEKTDSVAPVKEEVVVEVLKFNVDTSSSTINWKGYEKPTSTESFHFGTVKISSGSFEVTTENGESSVTGGSLAFDMTSIKSGEDLAKLEGHLKAPDFFNVQSFATAGFEVSGWENGAIEGTLNVVGSELNISAPATIDVTDGVATVNIEEFRVDVAPANMPFFVSDAELPAEEQHDPKIGISAVIVGM